MTAPFRPMTGIGIAAALRIALLPLAAPAWTADDPPIAPPGGFAYQEALEPVGPDARPAEEVTFLDLWNRTEDFRGRRVTIEGRAARRFRQPPVGSLPALTELWIASRQGDLTCLVYPEPAGSQAQVAAFPLGTQVRFTGTFVKQLQYPAEDTDRLAPLLVGPEAPAAVGPPPGGPSHPPFPLESLRAVDWLVAAIVGASVVFVILRQYLSRPRPRRQSPEALGPPPDFLDGSTKPRER